MLSYKHLTCLTTGCRLEKMRDELRSGLCEEHLTLQRIPTCQRFEILCCLFRFPSHTASVLYLCDLPTDFSISVGFMDISKLYGLCIFWLLVQTISVTWNPKELTEVDSVVLCRPQTSMDLIGIKKHGVDLLGPSLNLVEGLVHMRE